jgi:hypothetical protein
LIVVVRVVLVGVETVFSPSESRAIWSFQLWKYRNGEFFEAASLELGVPGAKVASVNRPWSSSWVI